MPKVTHRRLSRNMGSFQDPQSVFLLVKQLVIEALDNTTVKMAPFADADINDDEDYSAEYGECLSHIETYLKDIRTVKRFRYLVRRTCELFGSFADSLCDEDLCMDENYIQSWFLYLIVQRVHNKPSFINFRDRGTPWDWTLE